MTSNVYGVMTLKTHERKKTKQPGEPAAKDRMGKTKSGDWRQRREGIGVRWRLKICQPGRSRLCDWRKCVFYREVS